MTKCYTDASFDPKTKTAIIGWKFNGGESHINMLKNTTNTRAEIIGLIKLLTAIDADKKYIIYTDCLSILNRIESKNKLIEKNFMTKNGKELGNADLYKKLFVLLTSNITLIHINGHKSSHLKNDDDKEFSDLDKYVRKKLREYVKNLEKK